MDLNTLIAFSLFATGFLYATVGHGGASGYLAVLSLFAVPVAVYKPLILVLNILVAGMAFIQFSKMGYFKWKLCWPFLLTSIPMAFLGSAFKLNQNIYNLLLGLALIVPVIRLLSGPFPENVQKKELALVPALLFGALIGLVSGMLNIGGGIFLSPLLILLAWANTKEAAAASSLFIVFNSLSGLAGHSGQIILTGTSALWFSMAAAGGFAGAFFGSRRFAHKTVRYLLTIVLAIASCKLIFFM